MDALRRRASKERDETKGPREGEKEEETRAQEEQLARLSSAQEIQSLGRGKIVETLDLFSPRTETRFHLSDLLDVEGSGLDPRDVDGLIDLIDHALDELQRQGPHEQQLDLLRRSTASAGHKNGPLKIFVSNAALSRRPTEGSTEKPSL